MNEETVETSGPPVPSGTVRSPRVPLAAVIGAGILIVVSVALTFAGAVSTGVSWDEPWRVGSLNNYFDFGWFVDKVEGGLPVGDSTYVYAPIPDLFTHAIGVLSGAQEWGQAEATAAAYAARHVGIALISLLGLASAGAIAGVVLASWRWGVIAAAVLATTPVWSGHAMFNGSDMPVAAGYTMATLAVVLLARCSHRQSAVLWYVLSGALLTVGILLSIGTRPATWPAIVITCLIPVIATPIAAAAGARRARTIKAAVTVAAAVVAASALLALAYPKVFTDPVQLFRASVSQSANFGVDATAAAAPADTPSLLTSLGYLPSWLVIQLPLITLVLVLLGLVVGAFVVLRILVVSRLRSEQLWVVFAAAAVAAQLLVLPLGAAVMHSNVYDGIRQFLFIVPMIAVIATVGIWSLIVVTQSVRRGAVALQWVVWTLVGIGLVLPVVDQARLFPYGYTYVNEVAAREDINGRLATDYWRTSMRELIPYVPAEGDTSCTFDPLILGLVPIDCAMQGQLAPYWETRGSQSLGVPVPSGKYLYLETNRGRVDPGPGCSIIDKVTRPLHGQEVVMSYVAVCEAPCVVQEAAQCAGKDLAGAILDGWNLRGSNFAAADFTGTSLVLADLSGSNLSGANLTGAILDSANLSGADLTGADLTGANLTNVNLEGAILTDVIGLPSTVPAG